MLGESQAAQKARLEEASKGAKDLTDLIKRKKPAASEAPKVFEPRGIQSNGKRKAEVIDEVGEVGIGKRKKICDGVDD